MNDTIAGHEFVGGICVKLKNGVRCGRLWADIRCYGHEDKGEPDIAHDGNLADYEADQIEREREREDRAIDAAMGWVADTRYQGEDAGNDQTDCGC